MNQSKEPKTSKNSKISNFSKKKMFFWLFFVLQISNFLAMSHDNLSWVHYHLKGILWQFYKLGLKVPSGRDENDGIGHFAELGSSWPGEGWFWQSLNSWGFFLLRSGIHIEHHENIQKTGPDLCHSQVKTRQAVFCLTNLWFFFNSRL